MIELNLKNIFIWFFFAENGELLKKINKQQHSSEEIEKIQILREINY